MNVKTVRGTPGEKKKKKKTERYHTDLMKQRQYACWKLKLQGSNFGPSEAEMLKEETGIEWNEDREMEIEFISNNWQGS